MTQSTLQRTTRYLHSAQLIQKAISLQAIYTGQTKAQIRQRYAQMGRVSSDTIRAWQSGAARPQRPDEILALGRDAITIAKLDEAWLRAFLHAVDASTELRHRLLSELFCPANTMARTSVPFAYFLVCRDGARIPVCDLTNYSTPYVPAQAAEPLDAILKTYAALDFATLSSQLGLTQNRSALLMVGGASALTGDSYQRLRPLFEDVLVPLCERHQFIVLDGGTDCGIMKLMGQARARACATFPLIGVVPIDAVCLPGDERHHDRVSLQPDHSHFVFTPSATWSQQAYWLSKLTTVLAGHAPAVTVLVNGGEVSAYDVFHSQATGRAVIAVEGSGRLADQFALATRAGSSALCKLSLVASLADGAQLADMINQQLLPKPG